MEDISKETSGRAGRPEGFRPTNGGVGWRKDAIDNEPQVDASNNQSPEPNLPTPPMKTSEFLSTLRTHSDRPLFFSLGRARHVPAGYHLTEVKRVAFETMDCGAMTHRWRETHFELWTSPLPEIRLAYMAAGKFLSIVGRVEEKLPLDGETEAKIYFGDGNSFAALYSVDAVAVAHDRLEVRLTADKTQCKAATRRLNGLVASVTSCCSGAEKADGAVAAGGCCGVTERSGKTSDCCGVTEFATVDDGAGAPRPR